MRCHCAAFKRLWVSTICTTGRPDLRVYFIFPFSTVPWLCFSPFPQVGLPPDVRCIHVFFVVSPSPDAVPGADRTARGAAGHARVGLCSLLRPLRTDVFPAAEVRHDSALREFASVEAEERAPGTLRDTWRAVSRRMPRRRGDPSHTDSDGPAAQERAAQLRGNTAKRLREKANSRLQ